MKRGRRRGFQGFAWYTKQDDASEAEIELIVSSSKPLHRIQVQIPPHGEKTATYKVHYSW